MGELRALREVCAQPLRGERRVVGLRHLIVAVAAVAAPELAVVQKRHVRVDVRAAVLAAHHTGGTEIDDRQFGLTGGRVGERLHHQTEWHVRAQTQRRTGRHRIAHHLDVRRVARPHVRRLIRPTDRHRRRRQQQIRLRVGRRLRRHRRRLLLRVVIGAAAVERALRLRIGARVLRIRAVLGVVVLSSNTQTENTQNKPSQANVVVTIRQASHRRRQKQHSSAGVSCHSVAVIGVLSAAAVAGGSPPSSRAALRSGCSARGT